MEALQQLALPDGRLLDVRASGPPDGVPLVVHHGTPGSRAPFGVLERAAHAAGLRFVTLSRAGYGGSTRRAGRRVIDVVEDVAALLRSLDARRCLVAGWSGGGPHALACAAALPGVTAALVIAGVAPYAAPGLDWPEGMGEDNLAEFAAAAEGEAALRAVLDGAAIELRSATGPDVVASMSSLLPEVDRAVLSGDVGADLAAGFREGLAGGADGWIDDDLAFLAPWGFDLDSITVPVTLWQGAADLMVPIAHGRWLADAVPGLLAHLDDHHGHLSIAAGSAEAMVEELVRLGGA